MSRSTAIERHAPPADPALPSAPQAQTGVCAHPTPSAQAPAPRWRQAVDTHGRAMTRGAIWSRDLFNVVRIPLQVPLVGIPFAKVPAPGAPLSWASTALHMGALGVLSRSMLAVSRGGGALAGALAGACGATSGRAGAIESRTTRVLSLVLARPLLQAAQVVREEGADLAHGVGMAGAALGLLVGCALNRQDRPLQAELLPLHPAAQRPGNAHATQLHDGDLHALTQEVREHVVQQLGEGVPELSDLTLELARRSDLYPRRNTLLATLSGAAQADYDSRTLLGDATPRHLPEGAEQETPARLRIVPSNLRSATYDHVRAVIHHELVHHWQFAQYPQFAQTQDASRWMARMRWMEGHAVYNHTQAEAAIYTAAKFTPPRATAWRLHSNPEMQVRRTTLYEEIYAKGLEVMQAVQARPDAREVQHLAFSNPSLVDMLCGDDAAAEVELSPAFDTPRNRALVEELRGLNTVNLRAAQ